MDTGRMEAFSDAVIAIVITIMVLELKVPQGNDLAALKSITPIFLSYVLSFLYLGIYWNNHHHLLQAAERVNGGILWANLHLLFWLSLIPFVTGWMGENQFATLPVALYGADLLMAAIAYVILSHMLIALHGRDSTLSAAIGNDFKGKISVIIYALAILISIFNAWIALSIYALVAISWLVPNKRIERTLNQP